MNRRISVKEKAVIAVLCIWSFINTYVIIKNVTGEWYSRYGKHFVSIEGKSYIPSKIFYPFTYNESPNISSFDIRFYDYSEYFIYVGGVWMIYLLYQYLKGSNKIV